MIDLRRLTRNAAAVVAGLGVKVSSHRTTEEESEASLVREISRTPADYNFVASHEETPGSPHSYQIREDKPEFLIPSKPRDSSESIFLYKTKLKERLLQDSFKDSNFFEEHPRDKNLFPDELGDLPLSFRDPLTPYQLEAFYERHPEVRPDAIAVPAQPIDPITQRFS